MGKNNKNIQRVRHLNIYGLGNPFILCNTGSDQNPIYSSSNLMFGSVDSCDISRFQLNYIGQATTYLLNSTQKPEFGELEKAVVELDECRHLTEIPVFYNGEPVILVKQKKTGKPDYTDPCVLHFGKKFDSRQIPMTISFVGNHLVLTYRDALKIPKLKNKVEQYFEQIRADLEPNGKATISYKRKKKTCRKEAA